TCMSLHQCRNVTIIWACNKDCLPNAQAKHDPLPRRSLIDTALVIISFQISMLVAPDCTL
ncbi:MAG: hypothetical protein OSA05_03930, partial [Nitrospinaceae bacterium]|nr:hypothetical protein [Nitrospinaceae bacterium]